MINLKQGVGELSAGKDKLTQKDSAVSTSVSTEPGKRAKRASQTPRVVPPAPPKKIGWVVPRVFSDAKVKPFDQIEWEQRTAEITDDAGKVIFKQENVEVPKSWSLLATKVVVSKYFYGEHDTAERETSVRQLIHRISPHHRRLGHRGRLFQQGGRRDFLRGTDLALRQPIRRLQFAGLVQRRAVSSIRRRQEFRPRATGFTTARPARPSAPARNTNIRRAAPASSSPSRTTWKTSCDLAYSEAMLFKYGSGTGTDLTPIRSSREKLSGGGRPSGPLSFLKVYDQVANVVKSGGKTRRAAKMNTLRDWHGDIEEFIDAKQKEEKKAWALDRAGLRRLYNGDAYGSVMYQNENLSVRASDEFMQAALDGKEWWTRTVTDRQAAGKEGRREAAPQNRRRHLDLRRPRHAIRRRDPEMAHLQRHRADSLHQSVQRIRFPQQHRLQSRLAEPDEVQARGRHSSTSNGSRPPCAFSSPRRKSSWTTPAIRPRTSRKIPTSSARSAWALPTSARSS